MTQNVLNRIKQKRLHRNYNYDRRNSTLEGYSTDTGQSTQFIAFKHLSLLQIHLISPKKHRTERICAS